MRGVDPRSSARYWRLTVACAPSVSAELAAFLRKLGALGVLEERGAASRSSICAFFDDGWERDRLVEDVHEHVTALAARHGGTPGKVRVSALTADSWAEAWPEYFVPVAIGRRFVVGPPWMTARATERIAIVMESGLGFGTGHHPTTAGCLAMLETLLERECPERAIDLGTGSGLLAIATARLGVPHVFAVDTDPDAIGAAVTNAARNGVSDRVRCVVGDASAVETEPAPLVIANLLTPVHAQLASKYRRLVAPGGVAVLGGIREDEAPAVTTTVTSEGFTVADGLTVEGWTTLVLARTSP